MAVSRREREKVTVGGIDVAPGTVASIELPVSRLPTATYLSLPVRVIRGVEPGPRLFLSATVHGDEANGIEIIRRVLRRVTPDKLRGALVAVPIVNVFGFVEQSRYMPDRRDLNRSFPGSPQGPLASRLAHLVISELVAGCTHAIDLHTGSNERTNLPQVRADLSDRATRRLALAVDAHVALDSKPPAGSLREAAVRQGVKIALFEAGEARRFNEEAIGAGVRGVMRAMTALDMGPFVRPDRMAKRRTVELRKSRWVRARRGGLLRVQVHLGESVGRGQGLAIVSDVFGENAVTLTAPAAGIVIGRTLSPLVHQGDAVVHLGERRQRGR